MSWSSADTFKELLEKCSTNLSQGTLDKLVHLAVREAANNYKHVPILLERQMEKSKATTKARLNVLYVLSAILRKWRKKDGKYGKRLQDKLEIYAGYLSELPTSYWGSVAKIVKVWRKEKLLPEEALAHFQGFVIDTAATSEQPSLADADGATATKTGGRTTAGTASTYTPPPVAPDQSRVPHQNGAASAAVPADLASRAQAVLQSGLLAASQLPAKLLPPPPSTAAGAPDTSRKRKSRWEANDSTDAPASGAATTPKAAPRAPEPAASLPTPPPPQPPPRHPPSAQAYPPTAPAANAAWMPQPPLPQQPAQYSQPPPQWQWPPPHPQPPPHCPALPGPKRSTDLRQQGAYGSAPQPAPYAAAAPYPYSHPAAVPSQAPPPIVLPPPQLPPPAAAAPAASHPAPVMTIAPSQLPLPPVSAAPAMSHQPPLPPPEERKVDEGIVNLRAEAQALVSEVAEAALAHLRGPDLEPPGPPTQPPARKRTPWEAHSGAEETKHREGGNGATTAVEEVDESAKHQEGRGADGSETSAVTAAGAEKDQSDEGGKGKASEQPKAEGAEKPSQDLSREPDWSSMELPGLLDGGL